jgi:hypothetical protein
MKKQLFAAAVVTVFAGAALAADAVKSGPQVGDTLPGPFHPLNINGKNANEKNCLYCQFGDAPVVMVFAREVTPEVKALAKKLDACTEKHKDVEMGSCIIFCSDAKGLEKQLQTVCKDNKLDNCIIALDNPAGPDKYNFNKDAAVTVLVYKERVVKVNFSFKKGEFKDKDIEKIVEEVGKVTKK